VWHCTFLSFFFKWTFWAEYHAADTFLIELRFLLHGQGFNFVDHLAACEDL
jgi:hypothetical protein